MTAQQQLEEAIQKSWSTAMQYWSPFLLLSNPKHISGQSAIAQIHMGNRQISLNAKIIKDNNLFDCVEALLAHEVGHHVRYPGSLAVDARMRVLEKSLIPIEDFSTTNLFTDLMINEYLGNELKDQLIKIYQSFEHHHSWKNDPSFIFYLSLYERLWDLPEGAIMGKALEEFRIHFPGYRAEAFLLVDQLFTMEPNIYTQFIYFVSVISRYIKPIKGDTPNQKSGTCQQDQPNPEDWADALFPNAREQQAIERALRDGWITKEDAENIKDLDKRISYLPGVFNNKADKVPEIMAAYYRREADRYLVRPPSTSIQGEAIVPTTLEEWEPGESTRNIDWLTSYIQRGNKLGTALPFKRHQIAETEGFEEPFWKPKMEIYLDVSGSMPDPRCTRNAMTLAAQILATSAVRKGGWARALLYSHEYVKYWDWVRSEIEISKFLMHYMGGGTQFPFEILEDSLKECVNEQPIRVVITDHDFLMNFKEYQGAASLIAEAAEKSSPLILLLDEGCADCQVSRFRNLGAQVISIKEVEDFPYMAGKLSQVLFESSSNIEKGIL